MSDLSHDTGGVTSEVGHVPPQHGGAPHLDPTYYPSQLFWLTVSFVVLYVLMARSVLPRVQGVLERRQQHLGKDLDRADTLSREAEVARAGYEKLQMDARGNAQKLITESQTAIVAMQEKKFSEVDGDITERLAKARSAISKSQGELRGKLAPVAREVTAQVVDKLIGLKPTEKQLATTTLQTEQDS